MAKKKMWLASFLTDQDVPIPIKTDDVLDIGRKKTLAQLIDSIMSSIAGLKGGDIEAIKTELASLKTMLINFLTGEDDDNGVIDRLSELVKNIEANKNSIDALVSDKATKEALDAVIADVTALQAKSHEHTNQVVLDGISKDKTTGNLTFNGHELNGNTGIAFGTTTDAATVYDGKIKVVFQEIEWDDGTEEPAPEPTPEEPGQTETDPNETETGPAEPTE